jgi:hypothetical protein
MREGVMREEIRNLFAVSHHSYLLTLESAIDLS